MRVKVTRINIPAMSTIGHGWGLDEDGNEVRFAGDHREMRHIGEAMQHASHEQSIEVELEDWQVLSERAGGQRSVTAGREQSRQVASLKPSHGGR